MFPPPLPIPPLSSLQFSVLGLEGTGGAGGMCGGILAHGCEGRRLRSRFGAGLVGSNNSVSLLWLTGRYRVEPEPPVLALDAFPRLPQGCHPVKQSPVAFSHPSLPESLSFRLESRLSRAPSATEEWLLRNERKRKVRRR